MNEHDMRTGMTKGFTAGVHQDPPSTLSRGYVELNSGYLGPNRG